MSHTVIAGAGSPKAPAPASLRRARGTTFRATGAWLPDMDNNVELIRIRPGDLVGSSFTIEVVPSIINGQAVPTLDGGSPNQDFALYVYNGQ